MTATRKRRWFQFSLRTLLILTTLAATVLGVILGRINYLRRYAEFHEREAGRYIDESLEVDGLYSETDNPYAQERLYHLRIADAYRSACHRPWTIVDESKIAYTPPRGSYSWGR